MKNYQNLANDLSFSLILDLFFKNDVGRFSSYATHDYTFEWYAIVDKLDMNLKLEDILSRNSANKHYNWCTGA